MQQCHRFLPFPLPSGYNWKEGRGRRREEAVLIVLSFFSSIEPTDRSLARSLAPCIKGVELWS